MVIFGLKITANRAYLYEHTHNSKTLMGLRRKLLHANAGRDSADRHVERLLHNGTELTLLWAACRDCGVEKQVRVVYDRLMPKGKGGR